MFDIVVHQNNFGDGDIQQTINGRDIHLALDITREYSKWIKEQIDFHELIENIDYVVFATNGENPQGGRPRTEYHFTIEWAKHIALASRSPKGKAYRQALIDLEKRVVSQHHIIERTPERLIADRLDMWTKIGAFFEAPKHLVMIEAAKDIKLLGVEATPLLLASPAMDNIPDDQEMLEPTELAKRLGFASGRSMNNQIRNMGLQNRINGEWVPTDAAAGMFFKHSWTKGSKSGSNLKWNVSKVKAKLEAYTESYGSF